MEHIGPEIERLLNQIDQRRQREAQRGIKAWLLAPDIPTYDALMRGENVPVDQLRPQGVQRYGLRQRRTA